MKYKPPIPDPKYPLYFQKSGDPLLYHKIDGGMGIVQGTSCKVLEIEPDATVVHQDIVLERAGALMVKIQDSEGQPLCGVWATGISAENWRPAVPIKDDSCSAYGVEAGKPRLMVFYDPDKKLVGTRALKGDEKPPIAVKLGPAGSIKGRLLDADGKPLAGIAVEIQYRDREAAEIHRLIHKAKQVATDTTGAFTFDELIPKIKFAVFSLRRGKPLVEEGSKPRDPVLHMVKPGECRDLGAIRVELLPEKAGE